MKTIIDAVNELQGDLNNVSHIKDDDTYHCNVNYNADSGWWCSRGVYGDFVCTIDDFEVEVKTMSFYYARFDVGSIEDYLVADKAPLQTKLIAGKAYQFDCNGHKSIVGAFNGCGYFVDCNCNTYPYQNCTNVRPLTLGNK